MARSGVAALVLTVLVTACGPSVDARDVTEDFYEAYSRKELGQVWSLYAPEFFDGIPKAAWARQLARLQENVGAYRSHRLVSQRRGTTEEKGDAFVVLTYEVQYAKQLTTETFTLRALPGETRPRILTHDVRYTPR